MSNIIFEYCETDDPNFRGTNYLPRLQDYFNRAAAFGSLDILHFLLETQKSNLNLETALYWAAKMGRQKVVARLIEEGANAQAENQAALLQASELGFTNVMETLIFGGANANDLEVARMCVIWKRLTSLEVLCDYGFDLKANKEGLLELCYTAQFDEIKEFINKHS